MNRFKENSGKDNLVRYKFFKNSDGDIAVKPCSKDSNIHTDIREYGNAPSVNELADMLNKPNTVAMVGVDSATL